jgi:hypothetical protein
MRPLAILVCIPLLFCAAATVHAQDNMTMLAKMGLLPDQNRTYQDPSMKAYRGTKYLSNARNTDDKTFPLMRMFHSKSYMVTPYNSADYWAGNFKFKASDANLDSHSPVTSIIRLFKTRAMNTRADASGSEAFRTRDDVAVKETSHNVFRGKIQGKLDKEGPAALAGEDPIHQGQGDMHVMSIDEVRNLLNKTK